MADMTTHNTIDLIVQAAYKYRFVTKTSRTIFGRALVAANVAAVTEGDNDVLLIEDLDASAYRFTPFARKFKRDAVACAIQFYIDQASQAHTWEGSEEQRLVMRTAEKNAVKAGHYAVQDEGHYEYVEYDEDERWVPGTVQRTAFQVHIDALTDDEGTRPWEDITDDQRDPDSENYTESVMVRPIEVIQAEREAERQRIMAERTAQLAAEGRPATSQEQYLDDEDDEDWPDDDEDI